MSKILINRFKKFHKTYKAIEDDKLVPTSAKSLEGFLTKALKRHLLSPMGDGDELFDEHAVLEPFRAKINLAYRIGLISRGLAEDLLLVKDIRRSFRTQIDCSSLDYKTTAELCMRFKAPLPLKAKFKSFHEFFPDDPRGQFELTVVVLSALLEDIAAQTPRVPERPLY